MILLLLFAAAIGIWAWKTGLYRRLRYGDVAAFVAALLAIRLSTHGEWLPALAGFGWAGGWMWYRRGGVARARAPSPSMPIDEARGVLDVPPTADAATIRAAHRRLIVRVHPDAGGSAELARAVNAARDVLLADLGRNRTRAS